MSFKLSNTTLISWISFYTKSYATTNPTMPNASTSKQPQIFNSAFGASGTHSHSLHHPHQRLSAHFRLVVGKRVGLGFDEEVVGEGSTQISPNHSFEVHVVLELVEDGINDVDDGLVVVVGSLQPNQPGVSHVVELVLVGLVLVELLMARVVVTVGQGAALEDVVDVEEVVVVGSLHPNQPGVSHVVVELEDVLVEVAVVVVDSSKQPHHPGVLHVSVRVLVADVVLLLVVVVSVPLLSKNFQRTQSVQSVSSSHSGTASYSLITSLIIVKILCDQALLRHPRSLTVSYMQVLPVWQ